MKQASKGATRFQENYFGNLGSQSLLGDLFDGMPEIYFFAKDAEGRFVRMNQALLGALGLNEESDVLGKTDYDFFSQALADRYRTEDQRVMSTGAPAINQIWEVPTLSGVVNWYLASKIPLFDRQDRVIGIAGAMRGIRNAGAVLAPYESMRPLLKFIQENFAKKIPVAKLARLAHLSVSQLERRFQRLFSLSPSQYILKTRLDEACTQLARSDQAITQIAQDTGFYDHSYFIRQFRKRMDMTPRQYRARFS